MMWDVETTETFDNWFDAQTVALKEDLLAAMLPPYRFQGRCKDAGFL